jgi:hypothetical protein
MDDVSFSKRIQHQPRLMNEMLERVGVDRESIAAVDGGLAWFEACTKCIFCPEPKLCAEWLGGSSPTLRPDEFCPNTRLFRDCRNRAASPETKAPDSD